MAEEAVQERLPQRKPQETGTERISIGEGTLHVKEKLGSGGYARVHRAVLENPAGEKVDVAAKIFTPRTEDGQPVPSEAILVDAQREALMCRLVAGPNTLPFLFHDLGADGNPILLTMIASGGTLLDHIRGGMTHDAMIDSIHQLSVGLAAVHEVGIEHRDVKPANLFFDPEKNAWLLGDWGLAKFTGTSPDAEGEVRGSPHYVAPERISQGVTGDSPFGDQYSTAVLAYFVLTGHLPFGDKKSSDEVLRSHLYKEFPPFAQHIHDPVRLARLRPTEAVIRKAGAKNPKDRYATMLDFARALLIADGEGGKAAEDYTAELQQRSAKEDLLEETRAKLTTVDQDQTTSALRPADLPPIPKDIINQLKLTPRPVKAHQRRVDRPHSVLFRHKTKETFPAKISGFFRETLPKYFRTSKHLRRR